MWQQPYETRTLDSDDPIIDDIQFTQGGITGSAEAGDFDGLRQFFSDHWYDFGNGVKRWDDMVNDQSTFGQVYESYQRGYTGPMSFYVAKGGDQSNQELFVLLRVGRAGDRRRSLEDAPPSVLWKWT